jgi:hypothetical protein
MPLVILHHLLNVSVQLANKRGLKKLVSLGPISSVFPQIPRCYPVPGGNKYRNLALLVGGVSKIETINYAHKSRGSHI